MRHETLRDRSPIWHAFWLWYFEPKPFLINGYPIILQRYNRIWLQSALVHLAVLRGPGKAERPTVSAG